MGATTPRSVGVRRHAHAGQCAWCGKVAHATLLDALRAVARQASGPNRKAVRLYVYRCKRGKAWHLTSQAPRWPANAGTHYPPAAHS